MTDFAIGRRAVLGAGAATLALGVTTLPAFAQATRLRFIWWGSQERADRTTRTLALYKEAHPDVAVDGEFIGWADYWPRLATQVAGRNAPDLIQMDYRYLFEYARRGALLPLTDYMSGPLTISDFGQGNIDSCSVDGQLYGVNLGVNSSSIFTIPAAWEEAGVEAPSLGMTWETFAENCIAFAKGTPRENFFATADASGVEPSFEGWLRQQGRELYTADGKIGFEPADAAKWFTYWADLRKAGGCVTAEIQALDQFTIETGAITLGYAATGYAHSNQFVGHQQLNKETLAISAYPVTAGGKPGLYLKPSMMLSIAKGTAAPDAAVDLVNFFVMNPDAVNVLGVERGVPASKSMREALTPSLDDLGKAMVQYISDIQTEELVGPLPPPPPQGAGEIQFVLQRISQEVAFEASSPEDGGEQLVTEAASILERG